MPMRYFHRLPLSLRVIGVVALLLSLASLVTIATLFVLSIMGGAVYRQELANDPRAFAIAVNLNLLGLACGFVVNRYSARFRQPNWRQIPLDAFPPDSWPRQARTIALLAALPLCAITLAAIITPTQDVAVLAVYLISLIGAVILTLTYVRLGVW